ncbi:HalOD1 output domain-containing protein [Haloarcula laminariae]|uniref:HalOD1 output domain-containing protein n=1 Tax=Haloarcula laminariae TaxID=2961577 RepID=UPI0021C5FCBC|nr:MULTISPECIES: HalOD1 output domain-containing protein [Halomicroarcula]
MSANAYDQRTSARDFVSSESESLSDTVIRAVSAVTGLDAVPGPDADSALDPLYTAIDPDALDSLFADESAGTVTFDYHDYTVTAHSTGRVVLEP